MFKCPHCGDSDGNFTQEVVGSASGIAIFEKEIGSIYYCLEPDTMNAQEPWSCGKCHEDIEGEPKDTWVEDNNGQ